MIYYYNIYLIFKYIETAECRIIICHTNEKKICKTYRKIEIDCFRFCMKQTMYWFYYFVCFFYGNE